MTLDRSTAGGSMKKFLYPVMSALFISVMVPLLSCDYLDYPYLIEPGWIDIVVDGRCGPWDESLNPSYSYDTGTHIGPTVVNVDTGMTIAPGDVLTITYVSGLANGGGGGIWNDANGEVTMQDDGSAHNNANYYIDPSELPTNLAQMAGVFANEYGVIVGRPFKIGNGPRTVVVPPGASQLQLGYFDGMMSDNGGAIVMRVEKR
jgi:hypothetical protein